MLNAAGVWGNCDSPPAVGPGQSRGQSIVYSGSRGFGYNRFRENNQTSDLRRQPRRVNLPNQYGKFSCYAICQLIYHWFKDCPRNVQGSNSKVTLFTLEVQKCYVQNFTLKHLIWQF